MAKKNRTTSTSNKTSRFPVAVDKDSSVNVRKIENGFIVSESGYTGKGKNQKWYNKDYYSKTNPLTVSGVGGASKSGGGMKFGNKK